MLTARRISLILLVCALGAYVGILGNGAEARNQLVDSTVVAAQLAADGHGAVNSVFDPTNGSASIGIENSRPSSASWTIAPLSHDGAGRHYLYLSADDPEFFSPSGTAIVTVDSKTVAVIRARQIGAEPQFVDYPRRQAIVMPPEATYGYRFALDDMKRCSDAPCEVSVRGLSMFWHVYRLAVMSEAPRFAAESAH